MGRFHYDMSIHTLPTASCNASNNDDHNCQLTLSPSLVGLHALGETPQYIPASTEN